MSEEVKKQFKLPSSLNPVLLIVIVVLAFAVGVLWQKVSSLEGGSAGKVASDTNVQGNAPTQPSADGKLPEAAAQKLSGIKEGDHVLGSKDAEILLIEYSDFECPYCASFHKTAHQAVEEYEGQVAWVYRHFPLDQIHPNARPAAEASECIAELGGEDAFWSFTDEVFESQQTSLSNLSAVATKLGVNAQNFDSCVESGKYQSRVESDYQDGIGVGVTGTPGNYVMNTKTNEVYSLPGAVPYATLKSTIDKAL